VRTTAGSTQRPSYLCFLVSAAKSTFLFCGELATYGSHTVFAPPRPGASACGWVDRAGSGHLGGRAGGPTDQGVARELAESSRTPSAGVRAGGLPRGPAGPLQTRAEWPGLARCGQGRRWRAPQSRERPGGAHCRKTNPRSARPPPSRTGVAFRQCAVSGRFRDWDPRRGRPCPNSSEPGHLADPCHRSSVTRLLRLSWRRGALSSVARPRSARGKTWSSFCATPPQARPTKCPTSRDALALAKRATKQAPDPRLCALRARVRVCVSPCVVRVFWWPLTGRPLEFTLLAPNTGRRCT
jgi:hypothetical protein